MAVSDSSGKIFRARRSKDFFIDRRVDNDEIYQYVLFALDEGDNESVPTLTGFQESGVIEDLPENTNVQQTVDVKYDNALLLTNVVSISTRPDIAIDAADNIHVVWQDDRYGHDEVFYGKFDRAAQAWTTSARGGSDIRITNVGGRYHARTPAITVTNDGDVVIVWQSNMCAVDKEDIFISYYDNAQQQWFGSGFGKPDLRVTNGSSNSFSPDIESDFNGNLYVTFTDDRSGSQKIYLKVLGRLTESTDEKQDDVTGCFLPPAENVQCKVIPFREAVKLIGVEQALALVPDIGTMSIEEIYNSSIQVCVDTSDNVTVIDYMPESGIDLQSPASPVRFASTVEVTKTQRLFNKDLTSILGSPSFDLKPEDIAAAEAEFMEIPVVSNVKVNFNVDKQTYTHIRFTTEQENIADKPFYPFNVFEDNGQGTVTVPVLLSAGNGDKIVFFQSTGPEGASNIIFARLILDAGEPTFNIRLYKDSDLTVPLDNYLGRQVTGTGTIYVEITSDRPLQNAPTFDVLQMGAEDYTNVTTEPVVESIIDLAEQGFFNDFDSADLDETLQIAEEQGLLGDLTIDQTRNSIESLTNPSVINALRELTCKNEDLDDAVTEETEEETTEETTEETAEETEPAEETTTESDELTPDTIAGRIGPIALKFVGEFEVMPADGIKYLDGQARLVVHGKDFVGNVV